MVDISSHLTPFFKTIFLDQIKEWVGIMTTTLSPDQFYQVSFQIENVGKTLEKTKKRVTWVFGKGETEYNITLVWSKHSGKRLVYMADAEVFFETKKTITFFHKWTSQDGATKFHIVATSVTPSKKFLSPNFLKFELIINGQRFVKLPFKDGTPAPEEEAREGPTSIFDIMFPQGYKETTLKSEGPYRTKKSLSKEVSEKVIKQANFNTHGTNQRLTTQ